MEKEPESIIIRNFEKVWKIEHTFYNLGKVKLPWAVPLRAAVYCMVFYLIFQIDWPLISLLPDSWRNLALPAVLAYLCSKKTLDGKNPLFWLKSQIIHLIRLITGANRINRYKIKDKAFGAKYRGYVTYRVHKEMGDMEEC